jgi:hypothetical protein
MSETEVFSELYKGVIYPQVNPEQEDGALNQIQDKLRTIFKNALDNSFNRQDY